MAPFRTLALSFSLVLASAASAGTAHAGEKLKVLVADKESLQYLAFWVAKGGGSFEREGVDVEIVVAPAPQRGKAPADSLLETGEVDAAVLSPSAYLRMIGAKAPIVVVANLFRNDPYALVARSSRKIPEAANAHDRLAALQGAGIAYPPASYGRLKALLTGQGFDIDKDFNPTVLLARDLGTPFKDKAVDAAYLGSPYLEKAVASGEASVVLDQARAEVPELGNRQTNVLAVTRRALTERHDVVASAVRAIAEAEKRIHASQPEAVEALAHEMPERPRRELEIAVQLYEPGIPETPEVRAQDLAPALALIPESVPRPELPADLSAYVAPELAASAAAKGAGRMRIIAIAALVAAVVAGLLLALRRRRAARA